MDVPIKLKLLYLLFSYIFMLLGQNRLVSSRTFLKREVYLHMKYQSTRQRITFKVIVKVFHSSYFLKQITSGCCLHERLTYVPSEDLGNGQVFIISDR